MATPAKGALLKKCATFKSFYSGGQVSFCEKSGRYFCLFEGGVKVVYADSLATLAYIHYHPKTAADDEHASPRNFQNIRWTGEQIVLFAVLSCGTKLITIERGGDIKLVQLRGCPFEAADASEEVSESLEFCVLSSQKAAIFGLCTAAALSADDSKLAIGSRDGSIEVFELDEKLSRVNKFSHVMVDRTIGISHLKFHPSLKLLYSGTENGRIKLFDLHRDHCIYEFEGHFDSITCMTFLRRGEPLGTVIGLVSASRDGTVCVWDLEQAEKSLMERISPSAARVSDAKQESRKRKLQNVFQLGMPMSVDETTHKFLKRIGISKSKTAERESNWAVLLEPNRVMPLITARASIDIVCQEEISCVEPIGLQRLRLGKKISTKMQWGLVTAGSQGILRLWDPQTKKCVFEDNIDSCFSPKSVPLTALIRLSDSSSSSSNIFLTANAEGGLVFWSSSLRPATAIMGTRGRIADLALMVSSPDPVNVVPGEIYSLICDGSASARVARLPLCTGKLPDAQTNKDGFAIGGSSERWLHGHDSPVVCGDVSSLSQLVATGAKDGTVKIWSVVSALCEATLTGHLGAVTAVKFGCRCRQKMLLLAVASEHDHGLRVWGVTRRETDSASDTTQSALLGFISEAHRKRINCLAVSPNDKMLASGSSDRSIKLWSLPELNCVASLSGHDRAVVDLHFSAIEQVLLSCSSDASARLWDLASNTCVKIYQADQPFTVVCFMPKCDMFLSGDSVGQLRVWDVKSGEGHQVISAHEGKMLSLKAISCQDGSLRVVTSGEDKEIVVWKDTSAAELAKIKSREAAKLREANEISLMLQQGSTAEALKLMLKHRKSVAMRLLLETRVAGVSSTIPLLVSRRVAHKVKGLMGSSQLETASSKKVVAGCSCPNFVLSTDVENYHKMVVQTVEAMKELVGQAPPFSRGQTTETDDLTSDEYLERLAETVMLWVYCIFVNLR